MAIGYERALSTLDCDLISGSVRCDRRGGVQSIVLGLVSDDTGVESCKAETMGHDAAVVVGPSGLDRFIEVDRSAAG